MAGASCYYSGCKAAPLWDVNNGDALACGVHLQGAIADAHGGDVRPYVNREAWNELADKTGTSCDVCVHNGMKERATAYVVKRVHHDTDPVLKTWVMACKIHAATMLSALGPGEHDITVTVKGA